MTRKRDVHFVETRKSTYGSEITSVSLTGSLGSGDLVGSSGTSSSLEGGGLLGSSDLLVSVCPLVSSPIFPDSHISSFNLSTGPSRISRVEFQSIQQFLSPSDSPGPWKVAHLVGLGVSLDLGDHDLSIGIGRDVNGLSYQLFLSCSNLHSTDLLVGKTRVLLGVEVLQVSLDGQCSSSLHSTQQPSSPSRPPAAVSTSDPQRSSHMPSVLSSST